MVVALRTAHSVVREERVDPPSSQLQVNSLRAISRLWAGTDRAIVVVVVEPRCQAGGRTRIGGGQLGAVGQPVERIRSDVCQLFGIRCTMIPNVNPMTKMCSRINSMSCGVVGAGSGGAALRGSTIEFMTMRTPNPYASALGMG